eukprot:snap_masked-scaffold_5-processed-gene-16.47-mRNA-1 protein AED:0.40 eAED:0.41 QI:0/-1/0/1/-1/1/1/0/338
MSSSKQGIILLLLFLASKYPELGLKLTKGYAATCLLSYLMYMYKTMRLKTLDKSEYVIITGGSEGLGFSIAECLIRKGYMNIILVSRSTEKLRKAKAKLEKLNGKAAVIIVSRDLREPGSGPKLFSRIKDIDENIVVGALVNNAGMGYQSLVHEMDDEKIETSIRLNCISVASLTTQYLKLLKEKKNHGLVVNVSSLAGESVSSNVVLYSATKSFLTAFSNGLSAESLYQSLFDISRPRFRVLNCIPGAIDTNFGAEDIVAFSLPGAHHSSHDVAQKIVEGMLSQVRLDGETIGPNGVLNNLLCRIQSPIISSRLTSLVSSVAWTPRSELGIYRYWKG